MYGIKLSSKTKTKNQVPKFLVFLLVVKRLPNPEISELNTRKSIFRKTLKQFIKHFSDIVLRCNLTLQVWQRNIKMPNHIKHYISYANRKLTIMKCLQSRGRLKNGF